jgi:hypothetical protein
MTHVTFCDGYFSHRSWMPVLQIWMCDSYMWGSLKQKAYRDSLYGLGALQNEIRNAVCNITEDELQWMSQITHTGAGCVMMQMDTTFSSFFLQVYEIKYYCSIDQEVIPVPLRFIECSLLRQWLWPGKAIPHVSLKCLSLRFGPLQSGLFPVV